MYHYTSRQYYQVQVSHTTDGWRIELVLQALPIAFVKKLETELFSEDRPDLQVYLAREPGQELGLIAFHHQPWNNCTRVWDLYVVTAYQRSGIGSQLLAIAHQQAQRWGARALVLETQSSNVPAINFYRKHHFDLVGLDVLSYSNEDIVNNEVRLELGKKLD